jgi:hypothetical protein
MGEAALAAFDLFGDAKHLATFRRTVGWFRGETSVRFRLGDSGRGACFDGLHPTGANRNQGAESTLAYLGAELNDLDIRRAFDARSSTAVVSA